MVDSKVNALALFRKQLEQHEVDIPRELLKRAAELLKVKPTTLHEMMKRLQISVEGATAS